MYDCFTALPWAYIALAAGLIYAAFLIWRMHSGRSAFSVEDMFLGTNGKADLTKVIVAAMAGLSIWVIVVLVSSKMSVDALLPTILGIFVIGRTITTSVSSIWPKTPPTPEGDNAATDKQPDRDEASRTR